VHQLGRSIVINGDSVQRVRREYDLGGYYLIRKPGDILGNIAVTPENWWNGYDVDLGEATSERFKWQGVWRRDFTGGLVLLNEPGAPTVSLQLPELLINLDGQAISVVHLTQRQAIVLKRNSFNLNNPKH
jgi:hypothetical protein